VPIGQHRFNRMRLILLWREGRLVIQPDRAETGDSSNDRGDLEPSFARGSPAAMLVRAVVACHAEELGKALDVVALPWSGFEIQADATCPIVPSAPCLDTIAVYSMIYGGDPRKRNQYVAASKQARDHSLIGRTIRGNVAYKLDAVTVVTNGAPGALLPCARAGMRGAGSFPDAPNARVSRYLAAFRRQIYSLAKYVSKPRLQVRSIQIATQKEGKGCCAVVLARPSSEERPGGCVSQVYRLLSGNGS
jgi:hypothetical protein